jgi:hypothetical protein
MRAGVAISIGALVVTAGAVWYFGALPFKTPGGSVPAGGTAAMTGRNLRVTDAAPEDLPGLAAFLAKVPFEQRSQFVRSKLTVLSAEAAADRAKIAAFLRSGADVEIERPALMSARFSKGRTTMRRYLLDLLEKFPPEEGVALAREVLADARDFRESYLCLRALEHFQPEANRADAVAAMQRTLTAAGRPVHAGREMETYLAEYDRFAEPVAHYSLDELHPQVMEVLREHPILAGRYTQAVEAFPPGQQATVYNDLFAHPEIAQELVNGTGTRSTDVWLSPTFRQQAARLFASGMSNGQQEAFVNSLAGETGLHFAPKPLAEPSQPVLQPTDPDKDVTQAKARLAMLEAVAPQAKSPESKAAVEDTRAAIQAEIAGNAEAPRKRLSPVTLPIPDALGDPAGVIDQPGGNAAQPGGGNAGNPEPAKTGN